ncbi:MAG: hypothetical protein ACYS3S_09145 [Planctomycetota bacterium]|jgi:predicted aspartyl protease
MSNHLRGKIKSKAPLIEITVGSRRRKNRLEVIVDTGCSCDLVMSRRKAKELGLQARYTSYALGAFDNKEPTTIFEGYVKGWFGRSRSVFVHAPENCPTPLVGMGLLNKKTISFLEECKEKDVHIVPSVACKKIAGKCPACPIR